MAEIKTEYERLKICVSQLAAESGFPLEWGKTCSEKPMLALGNVAAVFEAPAIFNSLSLDHHIRIRFTRKFGSEQENDGKSRLEEVFWDLKPSIPNGAFVWTVTDESTVHCATEALADEIAKRLVSYHVAYERAYGRAA